MENHKAKASYSNNKEEVKTTLSLISFKEDDAVIVYSPALDLSGCGNTLAEAKSSFQIVLEEFFKYTIEHNTLGKELKRLGWEVSGSPTKPQIKSAPDISTSLQVNKGFKKLMEEKDFNKFSKEVKIPELA
jgi:hypothetical protein